MKATLLIGCLVAAKLIIAVLLFKEVKCRDEVVDAMEWSTANEAAVPMANGVKAPIKVSE